MNNIKYIKKEQIIYKIQEIISISSSVVVASLNGIKSNVINLLRREARDFGVCIKVVPNTLMRRVIIKTPYECLGKILVGQIMIAFSTKKPSAAAYILSNFSKTHEMFKIKGAVFERKFIDSDEIHFLSNLPDYNEAILKLISFMQLISIGNLMYILKMLPK